MYVKTYAMSFNNGLKDTDKVSYRNLSVSFKKADGTYENEYWSARFIGKAKEAIDAMPERAKVLIQGNVHNGFNKEKGTFSPYILVTTVEAA